MNFCDLAVAGVADIQPYAPGKPVEELQRQYGLRDVVKLASNESPLGPSKEASAAVAMAMKNMHRYPDGNGYALKVALADKYQLSIEQITLGNGSNDVLELAARTFAGVGDEVIYSEHAFAIYPLVTKAIGATGIEAQAKDYGHDLTAIYDCITRRTRLIFIANPNNPTGSWVELAELKAFLEKVPDNIVVVLDEAYTEYIEKTENTPAWLQAFPNLIICRTFSKAYGLAGLRVGYALSIPQVADLLNRIRQPFNVNSPAQAAALAALDDEDYLQRAREVNKAGMQQLTVGVEQLGLSYMPSKGNFLTVNVYCNAAEIYQGLLQEGVIVRPVANYGLPQHLRVSIGLQHENQRFLNALAKVMGRNHD